MIKSNDGFRIAGVKIVMGEKPFWKLYSLFALIYFIGTIACFSLISRNAWNVTDFFYGIFLIGLFGFTYQRTIFTVKVWRYIFVIAVLFYLHDWIVMPLVLVFFAELPVLKMIYLKLFSVPFIPIVFALYLYAWCSKSLWKNNIKLNPGRGETGTSLSNSTTCK